MSLCFLNYFCLLSAYFEKVLREPRLNTLRSVFVLFFATVFDTEVVKLSIIDYQANQAIISLIQISYWRLIMALLFHSVGARALPSIVVSYVSWKVPFLGIHILMWL